LPQNKDKYKNKNKAVVLPMDGFINKGTGTCEELNQIAVRLRTIFSRRT
jgi:hypothetical protein